MDLRKRYVLTAGGIVFLLISLVTTVRFIIGSSAFVSYENAKTKGSKSAPIHLVEYSDFQCPACRFALASIEELRNQFPGVIQIEYRYFPLEHAHRWALLAATFAECATEEGKFWEFHDKLFLEQDVWSKSEDVLPLFAQYTQELGLKRTNLEACLASPKALAKVKREHSMGVKQGVQSTPTIFINDRAFVGTVQLKTQGSAFVIEELKKSNQAKQA